MVMDWVPLQGYNDGLLVASGGRIDIELMTDAEWIDTNVTGRIELQKRYQIKRIIGYWSVFDNGTAVSRNEVWLRCWPAFKEPASGAVTTPGIVDDFQNPLASGPANQKWWWERVRPAVDILGSGEVWHNSGSSVDHPFNFMADFSPNMWLTGQQTPVLSVENNCEQDVNIIHRWRALVVT